MKKNNNIFEQCFTQIFNAREKNFIKSVKKHVLQSLQVGRSLNKLSSLTEDIEDLEMRARLLKVLLVQMENRLNLCSVKEELIKETK